MNENTLQVTSKDIDVHLSKERITQMLTIAAQFHKADCFGKDVKNEYQAFTKIQAGAEMGMPPMEAMSSLYIVNGNVTMWGKALTMRLRKFGWKIAYDDSKPNECKATIKKDDEEYSYTATKDELVALKSMAATFALKDKLKWHAIGRICRFYVPEVLGSISYVAEEIEESDFKPKGSTETTNTNLDSIEVKGKKKPPLDKEVVEGEVVEEEPNKEMPDYFKKIKESKSLTILKTIYDQAKNDYKDSLPENLEQSFREKEVELQEEIDTSKKEEKFYKDNPKK